MIFRERKERQRVEQSRVCQSVWLEQRPAVGHRVPSPDQGQTLSPRGTARRAAPPLHWGLLLGEDSLKTLQICFVHPCGIQIRKRVCTQTAQQPSAEGSIHVLKMCDCHATHYLPLKKDAAVHFQIPKAHLNGSNCHLQFHNEVQIKPDLKSILDACILDIKLIYMHKEIRMQQVLTSKRSTLFHKKVLFSFKYNC